MLLKSKKGFTLIELLLAISILSIILIMTSSAVVMMFEAHNDSYADYDLQSAARIFSTQLSETIKYSQALFALPVEYVSDVRKMDPGWDYITLSDDKRSVLHFQYDDGLGTHVESVMIKPQDNITYEILFEKKSAQHEVDGGTDIVVNDSILYFTIVAHNMVKNDEGEWVKSSQKIVMESEVDALNALQVVVKGTESDPAIALAYRKDDKTYGEGRSHVVKIALVLDKSGSMDDEENVGGIYHEGRWVREYGRWRWIPPYWEGGVTDTRMNFLKKALIGDGIIGTSGMIADFAVYPNFEISIIPFDARANSTPFYNAKTDKADLVNYIDNLIPGGATNTGDGIRLAYYGITSFSDPAYSENVEEHDFTIILVDGASNTFSYTSYSDTYDYRGYLDRNYVYQLAASGGYNTDGGGWYTNESGFDYVTTMGRKIIQQDNYDGEYYLIGYMDRGSSGLTNIINALSIPESQIYSYSDDDFDLSLIFTEIATDIMAKTWLVTGPQIIETGGDGDE